MRHIKGVVRLAALVAAACFLINPRARMKGLEKRSLLMGKFSTARAV